MKGSIERPPDRVKPGPIALRPQVARQLSVIMDPDQVVELRAPSLNHKLVRRMVVNLAARFTIRLRLIIDDRRAERT